MFSSHFLGNRLLLASEWYCYYGSLMIGFDARTLLEFFVKYEKSAIDLILASNSEKGIFKDLKGCKVILWPLLTLNISGM